MNGNPYGYCVNSALLCDEGLHGVKGSNNVENPGIN